MLREDLIRDLRVLAVQEGRNLYEVMEEAFEAYLERRHLAGARRSPACTMPLCR